MYISSVLIDSNGLAYWHSTGAYHNKELFLNFCCLFIFKTFYDKYFVSCAYVKFTHFNL